MKQAIGTSIYYFRQFYDRIYRRFTGGVQIDYEF
jgi:hypothetical protein